MIPVVFISGLYTVSDLISDVCCLREMCSGHLLCDLCLNHGEMFSSPH